MLSFLVTIAMAGVAAATQPQRNVSFNYVRDIVDYEGSAYHITCEYNETTRALVIHMKEEGSEALKTLRYQWKSEAGTVDETYHFKNNGSKKVTLSNVPPRTRVSIGLVPNREHEQGGKYWVYIGSTCWTGAKIGKPSKPQIKQTSAFTHPLVEWTASRNPNGPIDGYDFIWCFTPRQDNKVKLVQTREVTKHNVHAMEQRVANKSAPVTQRPESNVTSSTESTTASPTSTTTTTTAKPEPKCETKDIPVNPANVDVFTGYKTIIDNYDATQQYRVCIRAYNWKGTDKIVSEEECQMRQERAYFEREYFQMCPQ